MQTQRSFGTVIRPAPLINECKHGSSAGYGRWLKSSPSPRRPPTLERCIWFHPLPSHEEAFEVVEAASADEAIAILEGRFDTTVVFTDIQMPGSMDGLKLAAATRDRWPPNKIVAMSGQVKLDPCDLPRGRRFLQKPYSPAEVMKTLRELMAA
jgi:CheY-like chemotaxis protein